MIDLQQKALQLDQQDVLAPFRKRFCIPKTKEGKDAIYFCGNSLGLMSTGIRTAVGQELMDWEHHGVLGHHEAQYPWYKYHEFLTKPMAAVVGALPEEVVVMNTLTVNVHLMMVSFYRPDAKRHKILIEYSAFPSDRYAVESQIRFHGFDPASSLVVLEPEPGTHYISKERIQQVFDEHGDELALALIGSVNYYTGQAYPIRYMTELAHGHGSRIGFDLAHGAGNLALALHDDGPDFAVWCGYKYLNGGPGTLAGCFVHQRHHDHAQLPRFAGWWGHNKQTRFAMGPRFEGMPGAEGWQLSNPPILPMACLRESLSIFETAGMDNIRAKNLALGDFLLEGIKSLGRTDMESITPIAADERGAQWSLRMLQGNKGMFEKLTQRGVIADWREPDVIRIAPVALYNQFAELAEFLELLKQL